MDMDKQEPQGHSDNEHMAATVNGQRDIARVLTDLMTHQLLLTGVGNRGRQKLLGQIVGVEEFDGHFLLECLSESCKSDEDILDKDGVSFSAMYDNQCVQFVVGEAQRSQHEGRTICRLAMPSSLVCVQRRGIFRASVPQSNPAMCWLQTADSRKYAGTVLDIGVGGMGLLYESDAPIFELGEVVYGCRLSVPGVGEFVVSLRVRNQMNLVLADGKKKWRLGCEFVDLSSAVERELQRYIIKIGRINRPQS